MAPRSVGADSEADRVKVAWTHEMVMDTWHRGFQINGEAALSTASDSYRFDTSDHLMTFIHNERSNLNLFSGRTKVVLISNAYGSVEPHHACAFKVSMIRP